MKVEEKFLLVSLSGLDHVTIAELLGFSTLTTNLSRHSDLGSLGTRFHDEAKDSIASAAHSKSTKQLVLE